MPGFKYDGSYTAYQSTTPTNVRKQYSAGVQRIPKVTDLYNTAKVYFKNKNHCFYLQSLKVYWPNKRPAYAQTVKNPGFNFDAHSSSPRLLQLTL